MDLERLDEALYWLKRGPNEASIQHVRTLAAAARAYRDLLANFPTDEDVADAAYALADFHMDFEDHGSYAHWLEPARLALQAVADARRTEEGT